MNQALLPWRTPRPAKSAAKKRHLNLRWLCLRPPGKLDVDETKLLAQILAADPELAQDHDLLQRFRQTIRAQDVAALEGWVQNAQDSGLRPFQAFANGLLDDWSAVEAALRLPWSDGPVEGHVNKVKLIERAGFGRAKIDLLR